MPVISVYLTVLEFLHLLYRQVSLDAIVQVRQVHGKTPVPLIGVYLTVLGFLHHLTGVEWAHGLFLFPLVLGKK